MEATATIDELVNELCARHGCHTVILYGSRGVGRADPHSDYDLLGVRATGGTARDVRTWRGLEIDAFIHDEASLAEELEPGFVRLRTGTVLRQEGTCGTRLLQRVRDLEARGPAPLSAEELNTFRQWTAKMLSRIAQDDVVAHYRRVSLLTELLTLYFSVRRLWFLGPKESLSWLRDHDARAHDAFAEALRPSATLDAIGRLVTVVLEPGPHGRG